MKKKLKSVNGLLLLSCCWIAPSFAADFFTIIGPDGRPMIIQQKAPAAKPKTERSATHTDERLQKESQPTAQAEQREIKSIVKNKSVKENEPQDAKASIDIKQKEQDHAQVNPIFMHEKITQKSDAVTKNVAHNQQKEDDLATLAAPKFSPQQHQTIKSQSTPIISSPSKTPIKTVENTSSSNASSIQSQAKNPVMQDNSKFTEIDGVQYVDNEYLEDREFNLEGKKRFYIMPDSSNAGGRSFQTVEREKGISKSIFSKFLKHSDQVQQPISLASTYFRLPKEQVVENLEQSCFTGKKIDKAKQLSIDKDEIGFWPVAPIKENFAYEVVKLDSSVQNIQLRSYASSQKKPTYYWPLVVFLDHKGCVIEGVSGFKSEDVESNNTQYSALAGVLKKPEQARYLFMTPLLESVDIKMQTLSNTGQIKLSVLR